MFLSARLFRLEFGFALVAALALTQVAAVNFLRLAVLINPKVGNGQIVDLIAFLVGHNGVALRQIGSDAHDFVRVRRLILSANQCGAKRQNQKNKNLATVKVFINKTLG